MFFTQTSRWSKGCAQSPLPGHEPNAFSGSSAADFCWWSSGEIIISTLPTFWVSSSFRHPFFPTVFFLKGLMMMNVGQHGLPILIFGAIFRHSTLTADWGAFWGPVFRDVPQVSTFEEEPEFVFSKWEVGPATYGNLNAFLFHFGASKSSWYWNWKRRIVHWFPLDGSQGQAPAPNRLGIKTWMHPSKCGMMRNSAS